MSILTTIQKQHYKNIRTLSKDNESAEEYSTYKRKLMDVQEVQESVYTQTVLWWLLAGVCKQSVLASILMDLCVEKWRVSGWAHTLMWHASLHNTLSLLYLTVAHLVWGPLFQQVPGSTAQSVPSVVQSVA